VNKKKKEINRKIKRENSDADCYDNPEKPSENGTFMNFALSEARVSQSQFLNPGLHSNFYLFFPSLINNNPIPNF